MDHKILLTLRKKCFPRPSASGNISFPGKAKTHVLQNTSQELYDVLKLHNFDALSFF